MSFIDLELMEIQLSDIMAGSILCSFTLFDKKIPLLYTYYKRGLANFLEVGQMT